MPFTPAILNVESNLIFVHFPILYFHFKHLRLQYSSRAHFISIVNFMHTIQIRHKKTVRKIVMISGRAHLIGCSSSKLIQVPKHDRWFMCRLNVNRSDPIQSDTNRYNLFSWILYGFSANQCKINGLTIIINQRIGFFARKKKKYSEKGWKLYGVS